MKQKKRRFVANVSVIRPQQVVTIPMYANGDIPVSDDFSMIEYLGLPPWWKEEWLNPDTPASQQEFEQARQQWVRKHK